MASIEFYHFTDVGLSATNQISLIDNIANQTNICCMIDDYNFNHTIDSIPKSIIEITDIIAFESSFSNHAKDLVGSIATYQLNNITYLDRSKIILKKDGKWSCSYLTAIWYAARLGHIAYPSDTIFNSKATTSTSLINILDLKFKPSEKKAIKILKHLFPSINARQINNKYYENI